jgi:TetR/AcrR family transcriptional repressor of nem operon
MNKAEKTRQFIIETTAPIFNRKGYAGTSISDLTEATGLTKGSIYGNFENKDEVALAAFDHNYSLLRSILKQKMHLENNAINQLKVYLNVLGDPDYLKLLQYGCPILNTAIEADDTHEPLRKKANGAINQWYTTIEAIVKKGQENSEIKSDFDTSDFAYAYIALIEGGIMLTKVTGKKDGLDAAVKQAGKMLNEIAV